MFEVSLADLQGDEEHAFRKIRLRAGDVQGKNVLTNFWVWLAAEASFYHNSVLLLFLFNYSFFLNLQGMNFTTDKLRSLARKWQSLIEARVDVKTTDNYTLRMFCIGFTKRRSNQVKRTCYAQSSQIRQVHALMIHWFAFDVFNVWIRFFSPTGAITCDIFLISVSEENSWNLDFRN